MVYYDDGGRRIRRRVKRGAAVTTGGQPVDEATVKLVREMADKHPRFTVAEVHAQLRGQGHRNVTLETVRAVLLG